jgi:hypothetical protein
MREASASRTFRCVNRLHHSDRDEEDVMSVVDVFIPLIIGVLLVARPQIFFKSGGSEEEVAKRRSKIRKIGYVLVGVAALYCVIALVGTR